MVARMAKVDKIVKMIQSVSDEDALEVERTALAETTGDHAKDPAEEVTDDGDS
jgi:hypothetical protein